MQNEMTEKPRLYKGCENCRYYSDRKCQKTGEELTMVCDDWKGRDKDERGTEDHSERGRNIFGVR